MPRLLRLGMSGDDVKTLQQYLNQRVAPTPPLVVDGIFGQQTHEAVKSFQRKLKIMVDGIVGPQTWKALMSEPCEAPPPLPEVWPVPEGAVLVTYNGSTVPFFTQFDCAWGARNLGNANRTLAQAGCAISSIAMVLKFYGRDMDPGKLDAYLDANQGYVGNCVVWDKAFKAGEKAGSPKLKVTQSNYTNQQHFSEVLDTRLAKNWPTVAQVDYGTDNDTSGDHFVVVVGRSQDGYYIINDPGTSSGNGAANPTQSITQLGKSTRKGGLNLVRLVLFDVS
ncbi:MAG: peptidoglycan-binding protein [Bryobacteraceae bacterium]|nr:peptidoglycan-binding protein [Bryobacteraceae bacterium]MDW8377756.1 peptidoglycan-binding protein [Bryobacterales bacterium]